MYLDSLQRGLHLPVIALGLFVAVSNAAADFTGEESPAMFTMPNDTNYASVPAKRNEAPPS